MHTRHLMYISCYTCTPLPLSPSHVHNVPHNGSSYMRDPSNIDPLEVLSHPKRKQEMKRQTCKHYMNTCTYTYPTTCTHVHVHTPHTPLHVHVHTPLLHVHTAPIMILNIIHLFPNTIGQEVGVCWGN